MKSCLYIVGQNSAEIDVNHTTTELHDDETANMNTSIDISKSDIREIIELNFFNDLDDLDIPNSKKVKIEEDKDIVKLGSSEEVNNIKVEDFQENQLNEIVPGSLDLIEIVKHEINSDDQDCTSIRNEDIDTKHDDEILDSDPSSLCEGFTDEEIVEAECRLETFKKIDAIFLANYKEDMSVYACGTPTGTYNFFAFFCQQLCRLHQEGSPLPNL